MLASRLSGGVLSIPARIAVSEKVTSPHEKCSLILDDINKFSIYPRSFMNHNRFQALIKSVTESANAGDDAPTDNVSLDLFHSGNFGPFLGDKNVYKLMMLVMLFLVGPGTRIQDIMQNLFQF